MTKCAYKPDVLGNNFEQFTISLKDDYEGQNVATLVRSLSQDKTDKAILYIHGFNDYFFQVEMADKFKEEGYNFYALDLRKYGRSYLPHQKFNDIKNLSDYYEEILISLEIIRSEGNNSAVLMGHSTGGLVCTLFAKDHSRSSLFDGVILNSPFFEFNLGAVLTALVPLAVAVGKILPKIQIGGVLSEKYGKSLHKDYYGEWEYKQDWKPNTPPPIGLGWLRAIAQGHKALKSPFKVLQPVLVLHSDKTATETEDKYQMLNTDAVLCVKDIERIAHNIIGDLETRTIERGMHDLILSAKPVREEVYEVIFDWLRHL